MTCEWVRDRLDQYLTAELSPPDVKAFEAHLKGCSECRTDVAAARTLGPLVAQLPKRIEPRNDLWPGIAPRLSPSRLGRWVAVPAWVAAAAAVMLVAGTAALTRWLAPPAAGSAGPSVEQVDARFGAAVVELTALYEQTRDSLPIETRALIERNLIVIERALAEARQALLRQPGNPTVEAMVEAAYRQKIAFLGRAAGLNRET